MGAISFFIIGAFLILFQLVSAARAKRSEMMEWAVPRAVEIAKRQGWVSSHRLMTQANLKKRSARHVLLEACRQEILYKAVNGRFYAPQVYSETYTNSMPKAA